MRQTRALEIMLSGRSAFLTGEPGAGKSYVVREFVEQSSRNIALTASTGIAATNIGGQTIHAWSGIGAAPLSAATVPDLCEEAFCRRTGRRIERHADPEAEVTGDRVHRWSLGVVVEHFLETGGSRLAEKKILLSKHRRGGLKRGSEDR